jgi:hypothetical protein
MAGGYYAFMDEYIKANSNGMLDNHYPGSACLWVFALGHKG